MKLKYIGLLFMGLMAGLFVACHDDDDKGLDIPQWNRFRTTKVQVYAHLSPQNLFYAGGQEAVATAIRNTPHAVALLDRTNAVYGQVAVINTGVEVARESKKNPVFVPAQYDAASQQMTGSTLLLPSTISEVTQHQVKDDCKYLETKVQAVQGIDMLFSHLSLNSQEMIAPAVEVCKRKMCDQTVLVGTVKRALLPELKSALAASLPADAYSWTEVENRKADSAYCIFVLTSSKWAFRGVAETGICGDLHCFELQIESLK